MFHSEDGILKFHNEETVKSWVLEYFESQPEAEFGDSGKFENKTRKGRQKKTKMKRKRSRNKSEKKLRR